MGTIRTERTFEMFKDLVDAAVVHRDLRISEDSSFYLVQLLDHFVSPSGLYGDVGNRPDHPLGPLLLSAEQAEGTERFLILRSVGDLALFLTGFFYASLDARRVDARYYSRVGETAYVTAACACRSRPNADLFEELARQFVKLTLVLHEVSRACDTADRPDLMDLYDRFQAAPDDHASAMLRHYGILGLGDGDLGKLH